MFKINTNYLIRIEYHF